MKSGAINDITIASEFLIVAVRDIAAGKGVEGASVQQSREWALRKLSPLIQTRALDHIVRTGKQSPA